MALIQTENLKKYFDTPAGALHAVDDISINVERGQTLGIVGESGCGKSTLGKLLIRMLDPTDGRILYDNREIGSLSEKRFRPWRRRMQMIFQDPYASLNPRMSVSSLIAEPIRTFNLVKDRRELDKMVFELMDTVGLARRLARSYPHELDGGRRQRIGIARALSLEPEFIVCDEPVSALDVSIQAQILNLLMDLQEEHDLTYMFITHDMSVVRHVSDEICVMYLGQIIEKCSTRELFNNTMHPYSKALLSAIPRPTLDRGGERIILSGEIGSPIEPANNCRFAPRCEYAVDGCFQSEPEFKEYGKGGHFVKCHRVRELNAVGKAEGL